MSLEGDIRTALLTMDAVTALVGTGNSARIRPYELQSIDDRKEPHIIVQVDSQPRENTLDGTGGALINADVNLSCRAMTRQAARELADAVKTNGTDPGTGMAFYGGSGAAFDSWIEDAVSSTIGWGDDSKRVWHTVELSCIAQYTEVV
jgi:hypothetical protein